MQLTEEQLESWDNDGFLLVPRMFDAEEAALFSTVARAVRLYFSLLLHLFLLLLRLPPA